MIKSNRAVILEQEVHELLELGHLFPIRPKGHDILKVVELAQFPSFPLPDNGIALKGNYSTRRPVELRNLKHTLDDIPRGCGVDREPPRRCRHIGRPAMERYFLPGLADLRRIRSQISVIAVWRIKPRPAGPARALGLAVVLLIIQNLLAGDVVITELEPVITTVHLAFATAVFASIILACAMMYTLEKRSSPQHPAKQR